MKINRCAAAIRNTVDEEECGEMTMSLSGIPVIVMPSIALFVRDRGCGFVELVVTC